MNECDHEAGILRPWATRDCCAMEINSDLFSPPFVFSYSHPPIILSTKTKPSGFRAVLRCQKSEAVSIMNIS